MVLGNQQQLARIRADAVDRRHRRLHAQRHETLIEVVEPPWKKVHIHRRELETGVAQIDRAIERRSVFLPLAAQPALDVRHGIEKTTFDVE
jgi:hypothetical protein